MPVRIDRVRPEDLAAIAKIERESFSDPWSENSFRDVLNHARIYFACARDNGTKHQGDSDSVLGYVVAWFASGEGEIANLAVAPDARARGVGAALLDAALAEARHVGTSELFLEVRGSNVRARRLYESRGFVEVGRRKNYYRRPTEDAVILCRSERQADAKAKHDD